MCMYQQPSWHADKNEHFYRDRPQPYVACGLQSVSRTGVERTAAPSIVYIRNLRWLHSTTSHWYSEAKLFKSLKKTATGLLMWHPCLWEQRVKTPLDHNLFLERFCCFWICLLEKLVRCIRRLFSDSLNFSFAHLIQTVHTVHSP